MKRRSALASGLLALPPLHAAPRTVLTVATFPLLNQIAEAALPAWRKLHPDVDLHIVNRQYIDHHTAMTTALSTAAGLPDVMALESTFVGRFAQGLGLEDLSREPYRVDRFRARLVPFAYQQAIAPSGAVVAVPTDIGPGTMLYRKDIVERAGVDADALTRSWDSYVEAGRRIKAATGAYLIADVHEIKDILLRTGIQPGEGLYFDRNAKVLVTSERFVRAFEVALAARRLGLDARVKAWTSDWTQGFKHGTLATELGGAWLVGQLSNWVAPDTA
ncbi:MAG TPA: ABC transporter substrate-binding protein, partial [Burkholderiaceae bacterium]